MAITTPHQSQAGISVGSGGRAANYVGQSAFVTPGQAAMPGALQQLAGGIEKVGNAVFDVALDRRRLQNDRNLLRQKIELEDALRQDESNFMATRKGVDAFTAIEHREAWWEEKRKEYGKTWSGNPWLTKNFDSMIEGLRGPSMGRAVAYRDQQEEADTKAMEAALDRNFEADMANARLDPALRKQIMQEYINDISRLHGGRLIKATEENKTLPDDVAKLVDASAAEYGVDPSLVKGIMVADSALFGTTGRADILNDKVDATTESFAYLLDKYKGNVQYALMAHDLGAKDVDKWIAEGGRADGIPEETRKYVADVMKAQADYSGEPGKIVRVGGKNISAKIGWADRVFHTEEVENLLARDQYDEAEKYVYANQGRFGEKSNDLMAKVRSEKSSNAAREIWEKHRPDNDTSAANIDQMFEEVDKRLGDNPNGAKAARAELRELFSAHNASVAQRADENLDVVWGAQADGASLAVIRAMPEFRKLSGGERSKIVNFMSAQVRTTSQEAKEAQQAVWDVRYYEIDIDPDGLAAMTPGEFQAVRAEVGPANWQRLAARKRALTSPEALAEAKIDNDLFKTLAGKAGYDIAPQSEKGKLALANLRTELSDALVAIQKEQGRKLRPDEKEKILKNLVTKVSVKGEDRFLGIIPITSKKPLVSVEDMKNIVVPAADREKIINAFKARGYTPSEEQIIGGYLELQAEE